MEQNEINKYSFTNKEAQELADCINLLKKEIYNKLDELEEKIIESTRIVIKINGEVDVRDKTKFFSDLYNEVQMLKRIKSIPKVMTFLLTTLLILNLIIQIFGHFR